MSKPIVVVLLGDKWIGTEIVILFMAIRFGVGWFVGLNSTIFTAIGRPDLNIKVLIVVTAISIPAYIFGAQYGLFVFCIVRLITSVIGDCIYYFIAKKTLDLPLTFIRILLVPLLGAVFMALILCAFMSVISINNWFVLALAVIAGVISYVGCFYIINKEFVIWGYRYAVQIIR